METLLSMSTTFYISALILSYNYFCWLLSVSNSSVDVVVESIDDVRELAMAITAQMKKINLIFI